MMAAVAETVERFGGLDIAVANAGIAPEGATARTMPPEEWERVVEVDLMGVWRTVRAALPQISERNGQLVLIASLAAFVNGTMLSPYATAKAGVEALGRSLRTELAPFGASATVAYFGWIDTEMVREGLDRQPGGKRIQEALPKCVLPPAHRRRRRGGDRARHRGAGAAGLRAALVALRLGAAWPRQPAARQARRARRENRPHDPTLRGGTGGEERARGALAASHLNHGRASRANHHPAASSQPPSTSLG